LYSVIFFYLADAASADAGVHFYLINQILVMKMEALHGFLCTERTTLGGACDHLKPSGLLAIEISWLC